MVIFAPCDLRKVAATGGGDDMLNDKIQHELAMGESSSDTCFSPLKPTVLVIDDNQIIQSSLTIMLADRVNVLSAVSAKDGLYIAPQSVKTVFYKSLFPKP